MLKTQPGNLNNYYRKLVDDYFNKLLKEYEEINYFFEDTAPNKEILPNKSWIENSIVEGATGCINFIICSDNYLVKINKKYLNKDYLTDVISFNTNHLADVDDKNHVYGDIYISIEGFMKIKKTLAYRFQTNYTEF